jgi:cytochrome c oxidase subunit II
VRGFGAGFALLCAGCSGWQSAIDPAGPESRNLQHLLWLFFGVSAAVWVLVMLVLAVALMRRAAPSTAPLRPGSRGERGSAIAVSAAVAATAIVLVGLTVGSYRATSALGARGDEPLMVRLRGYQWWWEVTYLDPLPERVFVTANELHIPVGRAVTVDLVAADVIHSFWLPNLAGKQDLVPGRDNRISFTADRPGIYRGQCAEFCGLQHAHMSFFVIAEPPADFERWRSTQLQPAVAPMDTEQEAGQQLVTGKACAACHAVRGTGAVGTLAPDLTHVASRTYLAAGLLPMTRGSLAAWVADPQTIKPGNNMPAVPLSSDKLRSVSAYLASLK